jgi:uncharacterized protein (DUF2249 family)
MGRTARELIFELLDNDETPPPPRRRQSKLLPILDELPAGRGMEITRGLASVRCLVRRYRAKRGKEHRFTVRQVKPGVSRVWRLA